MERWWVMETIEPVKRVLQARKPKNDTKMFFFKHQSYWIFKKNGAMCWNFPRENGTMDFMKALTEACHVNHDT
jgi:hypothetical protein